jgi:hypothetical protein
MISKKIFVLFLIIILFSIFQTDASSLEDLINSYDFDFNADNSFIVKNYTDYAKDTNQNLINDTLFFNLLIGNRVEGNYLFYLGLEDGERIFTSSTKNYLSRGENNILLNLSLEFLSSESFNYSLKIYDENGSLVLRKFNLQTNSYSKYEKNFGVLNISDENFLNNSIRIYLTLNSLRNESYNITSFLKYNNSSLNSKKEISLKTGKNQLYFDFDKELIKKTHYNGSYLFERLNFGENSIDLDYSTSQYDFADFVKSSYIKSHEETTIDADNDGLIDCLKINFTIDKMQQENYSVEYFLYDSSGKLISSIFKTEFLDEDKNVINTFIKGSKIYESGANSPYTLKFILLKDSSDKVLDSLDNAFLYSSANLSYLDFERPPLPDLTISNASITEDKINITIINKGDFPAFNIFLELFQNKSFSYKDSFFMLEANKTETFIFNISEDNSSFVIMIDPDDLVEESNEENNLLTFS